MLAILRMPFTPLDIDARMIAAVSTLRRMPDPMVQQFGSSWPDVVRESIESYGYNAPTKIESAPTARDTSQMREAMEWLLWLDVLDRYIVWGKAKLKAIERLARENGVSVTDPANAWQYGVKAPHTD